MTGSVILATKGVTSQDKGRKNRARWWAENPIEQVRADFRALRPAGGFGLVMVDPPWSFSGNSIDSPGRNARRHYDTAPLEWIKALPIRDLLAKDAIVWLWATNPLLDRAFEVLKAWDLRFCTAGHWTKIDGKGRVCMGGGHTLRGSGEPYLIAKVGRPKSAKTVRGSFLGLRREHSRKPVEGYAAAVQLMPDVRRIEVFAREPREGWAIWGDETDHFIEGGQHDREKAEAAERRKAARAEKAASAQGQPGSGIPAPAD